jgi:diguanylate cyclase (GGDEF)-like protein
MNTEFSSEQKPFHVTISIGISTYAEGIKKGREEFIERADKALYHAKNSGRNRSTMWDEIKE